jgi:Protein of unknown function (DUF2628)
MADYLILTRPGADRFDSRALFIKDAFSFAAFLLPLPWLLWHRLWWHAAALFAFDLALVAFGNSDAADLTIALIGLAANLLMGLEGRAMLARHLERKGWTLQAALSAEMLNDAEALYYGNRIMPQIAQTSGSSPSASAPVLGLLQPYGGR